jgi:hypothetical protein
MVGVVEVAIAFKERADRNAREEAERRRLLRLRDEKARQNDAEERRIKQLYADADARARSVRLRALADAAETDAVARVASDALPVDLAAWIAWVHYIADEIDPLAHEEPIAFLSRNPR